MHNIFIHTGGKVRTTFHDFLYFCAFLKITLYEIIFFFRRKQVNFIVLLRQILFTGFEAFTLINLIGLAIGGTIIIQGMSLLDNFGQTEFV